MIFRFRNVVSLGLLALMVSGTAYAKNAGWAFYEFLEDPINSRSISMGSAGTALPENRGIYFYNPALPSITSRTYASFDYGRQYSDMDRAHIESAIISKTWFLDFGFTSHSTGEFKVADETGVYNGYTQSNQSIVGMLGGGFIKDNYSAALTFTGLQSKIGEYTSYGLCGNAGIMVTLIDKKLYAGAAALNIGRNSSYFDKKNLNLDYLPFTVRGGVSWNDTINKKYAYSVAADVVYSKNYETVMVPVGVEFWLFPVLAIRAGKRINFESDLFSIGVGLKVANIAFDVSFIPSRTGDDFGLKWSSGLTYSIASPKKTLAARKSELTDSSSIKVDSSAAIKRDSVPSFRAPVERKIIKKASDADSANVKDTLDGQLVDTVSSKGSVTDTVPQPVVTPQMHSLDTTAVKPQPDPLTTDTTVQKESEKSIEQKEPAVQSTVKKSIIEEDGALTPAVSDSVPVPVSQPKDSMSTVKDTD
ncbi:MAG: hypothetical protein ACM31E_12255 [Fibrobacterota bacterium]|nr:hypothetical protein [Chitinispirillaceae bacterium]